MATVQNGDSVVASVEKAKDKRPAVSGETFRQFMLSGKTKEMTQAECAEHLGMAVTSFLQRLFAYRHDYKVLKEKGVPVDKLPALPEFKSASRGGGKKQEFSENQRALLAFINENK